MYRRVFCRNLQQVRVDGKSTSGTEKDYLQKKLLAPAIYQAKWQ